MEQKIELRQFWEVLKKHCKITVILLLVVALMSGVTILIRVLVGTQSTRLPNFPPYQNP